MRANLKHKTIILIIVVLAFVADRTIKLYAQSLPDGTAFVIIPVLQFGSFLNPSLFFLPAWRIIPLIAFLVLAVLAILYLTIKDGGLRLNLTPIILGGASNVFDRFAYGGVIDIISLGNIMTINIADLLIIAGIIMFLRQPPPKKFNRPVP